uniref:hypothetical protein n=1 Tax=Bacillus sp. S2-R3J1-FB-BA1 TaxID=1973490 RepID=UPI002101A4CF
CVVTEMPLDCTFGDWWASAEGYKRQVVKKDRKGKTERNGRNNTLVSSIGVGRYDGILSVKYR